ncbi:flagellar hook-length control protein FliK [Paragemmobacter ruber]|uniref:Flagellar hook-length control protein-like C-terminal domain-containing protein n=1 Tax=Paragemmobacter ruber TaxID=1985673 RepID=A0ABW9Y4B5_9RHOB|nr:flagellar hook-length control protein FliK [Rhodobacter ruber]NBE07395.1 hypothetical protein [Rhodobacter ruber]
MIIPTILVPLGDLGFAARSFAGKTGIENGSNQAEFDPALLLDASSLPQRSDMAAVEQPTQSDKADAPSPTDLLLQMSASPDQGRMVQQIAAPSRVVGEVPLSAPASPEPSGPDATPVIRRVTPTLHPADSIVPLATSGVAEIIAPPVADMPPTRGEPATTAADPLSQPVGIIPAPDRPAMPRPAPVVAWPAAPLDPARPAQPRPEGRPPSGTAAPPSVTLPLPTVTPLSGPPAPLAAAPQPDARPASTIDLSAGTAFLQPLLGSVPRPDTDAPMMPVGQKRVEHSRKSDSSADGSAPPPLPFVSRREPSPTPATVATPILIPPAAPVPTSAPPITDRLPEAPTVVTAALLRPVRDGKREQDIAAPSAPSPLPTASVQQEPVTLPAAITAEGRIDRQTPAVPFDSRTAALPGDNLQPPQSPASALRLEPNMAENAEIAPVSGPVLSAVLLAIPDGPAEPVPLPPPVVTAIVDHVTQQPSPRLTAPLLPLIVETATAAQDGPVTVTLRPLELGTLRFEVSSRDQGIHLHLSVDQPATLDLLRRHSDLILQDLRQAGFVGVTLSYADGGASGQSSFGDTGREQAQHGQCPSAIAPQGPVPPIETASNTPPAVGAGTLNLRL